MIDKYRLEDMRRESGEKGELARWVIQLQADLDREIRKSASERAMLSRLAVIMHGSETDLNLLTVTAQSLMDRCKAGNSPVIPDGSTCKYCGGTGYFRWQQSENMCPCPCLGCDQLTAPKPRSGRS
ncbi:hypothetical protein [Citrobacter freundii]|uniref:hypothetical protein n=1 Tax=Citrobacter freundii TaxID=546 RepID=UPI00333A29E0